MNRYAIFPCTHLKLRYNAAHSTRGCVVVTAFLESEQPPVSDNTALTSTSGAADISSVVLFRARYNR